MSGLCKACAKRVSAAKARIRAHGEPKVSTSVYLRESQAARLRELSESSGMSIARLIRLGVDLVTGDDTE